MPVEPHILFISSWWPTRHTSEGTFVELHLLALQSRGCKCALLLTGEITLGNYIASGFKSAAFQNFRRNDAITFVENLAVHPKPLRWARKPLEYRKQHILKTSKRNVSAYIGKHGKPDFIFHHGVFDYAYLTRYLSACFDLPVWYMENSPNMSQQSIPCANPFDTKANLISFAVEAERRFAVTLAYVKRMGSLFGVPFEYCPNVITDDFFADPTMRHPPANTFHLVNVAILNPRKNQRLIIEAFAKAFPGDLSAHLSIAGDGPLKSELENIAKELGVGSRVAVLGFVHREGIVRLLDRAHCFVLGSHSETFGVVLVEAMARGLPVISTAIDGPTEIVTAENGLLCEPNNTDAMADAMQQLRTNYGRYKPEVVMRSVAKRYGPDAVYEIFFQNNYEPDAPI